MKYIKVLLFLIFGLVLVDAKAQSFETRDFKIAGLGILKMPIFLDTASQSTLKVLLTQRFLEHIDETKKMKLETEYKYKVIESMLSNYNSSTIMFWPSKALFTLATSFNPELNKRDTVSSLIENEISILPNILIKRKEFKYSASQLKQALIPQEEKNYLAKNLTETYKTALQLLRPDLEIRSISSKYFNYKSSFPALKISISFTISDLPDGIGYYQDIYTVYMDYSILMIRFEYNDNETKRWQQFEDYFFRELKLIP